MCLILNGEREQDILSGRNLPGMVGKDDGTDR
jgi:hypothetical protein